MVKRSNNTVLESIIHNKVFLKDCIPPESEYFSEKYPQVWGLPQIDAPLTPRQHTLASQWASKLFERSEGKPLEPLNTPMRCIVRGSYSLLSGRWLGFSSTDSTNSPARGKSKQYAPQGPNQYPSTR